MGTRGLTVHLNEISILEPRLRSVYTQGPPLELLFVTSQAYYLSNADRGRGEKIDKSLGKGRVREDGIAQCGVR